MWGIQWMWTDRFGWWVPMALVWNKAKQETISLLISHACWTSSQSHILVTWLLQPTTTTPTMLPTNSTHRPMTTHICLATRSPPFTIVSKPPAQTMPAIQDQQQPPWPHKKDKKNAQMTCQCENDMSMRKWHINVQMTQQRTNDTTMCKWHKPLQTTTHACINHQWPPPATTGLAHPTNTTPPPSIASNAN